MWHWINLAYRTHIHCVRGCKFRYRNIGNCYHCPFAGQISFYPEKILLRNCTITSLRNKPEDISFVRWGRLIELQSTLNTENSKYKWAMYWRIETGITRGDWASPQGVSWEDSDREVNLWAFTCSRTSSGLFNLTIGWNMRGDWAPIAKSKW